MINVLQDRARPDRSHDVWWLLAALIVALAGLTSIPASANHSTAAPSIDGQGIGPNMGPKTGGTWFRIHGSGFHPATGGVRVVFDKIGYTADATKVRVIDDNLLTAEAPPAPLDSTGATDIKVITNYGTATKISGWTYYDPTGAGTPREPRLSLSDSSGLSDTAQITATVENYPASTQIQIGQASPLATVLEPRRWSGANPEAKILSQPTTDSNGYWSGPITVTKSLGASDPAAVCPSTNTQASYGLQRCWIFATHLGNYLTRQAISFATGEPNPSAATLTWVNSNGSTNVLVGNTLNVSGNNWRGSPVFGSFTQSLLSSNVGTQLTIEICGISNTPSLCSTTKGTGSVSPTRYYSSTYGGGSNPNPPPAGLSGATLSGSIVVGSDTANCTSCFVKVTQARDSTYPGTENVEKTSNIKKING